jgi:hypothetical protein
VEVRASSNQKIKEKKKIKYIKTVSWNAVSRAALARTTPDNPPIVNINTKPNANNIEDVNLIEPP